jgi:hypothetical protein
MILTGVFSSSKAVTIFSLYIFRSLSPTDTSICLFFGHYLPPCYTFCYYNYFSYFFYLPLKLLTFLLKGAHFLYTLHWLPSRHCSCYTSSLSFLLSPLLIQHQGFQHQRLLPSTPSTINIFLSYLLQQDHSRLVTLPRTLT